MTRLQRRKVVEYINLKTMVEDVPENTLMMLKEDLKAIRNSNMKFDLVNFIDFCLNNNVDRYKALKVILVFMQNGMQRLEPNGYEYFLTNI